MLKNAIRFSYLNAKIRALKGQLLVRTDYDNLLKATGNNGITECLRYTAYNKNLGEGIYSYDELIDIYYKDLFENYNKIIESTCGIIRLLVHHFYQRYELENVKVLLRIICYDRHDEKPKPLFFPLEKHITFSVDNLLESKDLYELIHGLKGTWYHEPLENSLYRFEKEGETFPLEMALDQRYYKRLWEIVLSLTKKDKKIAKTLLGSYLDALNILWIIRFKENYNFSPEEILNYSLTDGRYITKRIRQRMSYSVNKTDIILNLETTPYKRHINGIEDIEEIYVHLLKYIISLVKKNWNSYPFQIGTIIDYILFKEIEIKDIVTLTESKRIGIQQKEIDKYIVNYAG